MTTALTPYTLAQIETEIQNLIGDSLGTRFSSSQLADAANYAIKVLVTKMGYTYKEGKIYNVSNTAIFPYGYCFPLVGTDPQSNAYDFRDYIEIRRVILGWGSGTLADILPAAPLIMTTISQEDANFPNWRNLSSVPCRWAMWTGDCIVALPLVNHTIVGDTAVSVGYVQMPPLLTVGADTVDARIPLQVQQYLKYAATSWLLSLDQSDTTSLGTAKLYMDTFNNLLGG